MDMNQRAQALAQHFTTLNAELISLIERSTESDLDQITTGEGWPVRVTAHHLAISHEPLAGLVQRIASGQPLPQLTLEMVHQANAQHATEYATVSKQAILDALQHSVAKAGTIISGLRDDALDRAVYFTLFNGDVTAQAAIEALLIGHVSGHLASIKRAVEQ